jgi:hypothetical protein
MFRKFKRSRLIQKLSRYKILKANAGNIIHNVIRMSLFLIYVIIYILLIYNTKTAIYDDPQIARDWK